MNNSGAAWVQRACQSVGEETGDGELVSDMGVCIRNRKSVCGGAREAGDRVSDW